MVVCWIFDCCGVCLILGELLFFWGEDFFCLVFAESPERFAIPEIFWGKLWGGIEVIGIIETIATIVAIVFLFLDVLGGETLCYLDF